MATWSPDQIEQLWINNGGAPGWAPLMAAIAGEESSGNDQALNNNPGTGDYSVGLWQINYFGSLNGERTQQYGSPSALLGNANLQAQAAINLLGNGSGLTNWQNDAAYNQWVAHGSPNQPSAATVSSWGVGNIGAPGGAPTGGGNTGGSTPKTQSGVAQLTGVAGILQDLDSWLNPVPQASGGVLGQLPIIGGIFQAPSDIETAIGEIVARGLFTLLFGAILIGGIFVIIRKPASVIAPIAIPALRTAQAGKRIGLQASQQSLTQQRVEQAGQRLALEPQRLEQSQQRIRVSAHKAVSARKVAGAREVSASASAVRAATQAQREERIRAKQKRGIF